MAMSIVQEMTRRWAQQGAAARPGVSADTLAAFERRYSVTLPEEFREYLRLANGTESCDSELISFAPIEAIRPVAETWGIADTGQDHYRGCFTFSDCAIHCWDFAIQLDHAGPHAGAVFRIEDARRRSEPIASSFGEWVAIYLQDPDKLQPKLRRADHRSL